MENNLLLLLEKARDEISQLNDTLQKISKKCGLGRADLLSELYLISNKKDKQVIDNIKSDFHRIGKINLPCDIKREKLPASMKQKVTGRDLLFLELIRNNSSEKENNAKSIKAMDDIELVDRYLKLKQFFLMERNKGILLGTLGYFDEEDFFAMIRQNDKLLIHSLENKIKPITILIDRYYPRSQTNHLIKGFPRIYGTSTEKITCNLEIAKDEACMIEMLVSPKNYMCSPKRVFNAMRIWNSDRDIEFQNVIMGKMENQVELPKKYQDILHEKNRNEEKTIQVPRYYTEQEMK